MRILLSTLTAGLLAAAIAIAGCGGTPPPTNLAFGVGCANDSECASGVCYIGGMESYCSLHCTAATQATDCAVPPTSGMCNMKNFCKK